MKETTNHTITECIHGTVSPAGTLHPTHTEGGGAKKKERYGGLRACASAAPRQAALRHAKRRLMLQDTTPENEMLR